MEYYTYIWRDPRKNKDGTPEPFYVGKGNGDRAWNSHRENKHFNNVVKAIKRNGLEPIREIIQANSENDAFELEIKLIEQYGRFDLGKGPLTNHTNGGDGAFVGCGNNHPNKLPERRKMFSEMYKIKMIGNKNANGNKSSAGTVWVNNGEIRKKLKVNELIPCGFKLGFKL